MADAVTSQTIADGDRIAVMKFTNISDGSGESAVAKVDVSALSAQSTTGAACSEVKIQQIFYALEGMSVDILWNASSNVICFTVSDSSPGHYDFREMGALPNNAGGGKNGDVLFTTVGHSSGDRYTIILVLEKKYG
tara:strand:- start:756 stop:1163 length:408 start_codon:yes stop_codon:yes gene_type:complete